MVGMDVPAKFPLRMVEGWKKDLFVVDYVGGRDGEKVFDKLRMRELDCNWDWTELWESEGDGPGLKVKWLLNPAVCTND